jgi:hypothetical protein
MRRQYEPFLFDHPLCSAHSFSVTCDDGGRAVDQAVSRRLPTAAARVPSQVMWDLWWTKWYWGRFSPSASVSPANHHSAKYSMLIYHPRLV